MCEKCDEKERICLLDANRLVTDVKVESKRIQEEVRKEKEKAINGFSQQMEDCLRDSAMFSTKMLIMFEDYKKLDPNNGDADKLINLLKSIENYGLMLQTNSSVLVQTANILTNRIRGS